jgi:hypothetical protein
LLILKLAHVIESANNCKQFFVQIQKHNYKIQIIGSGYFSEKQQKGLNKKLFQSKQKQKLLPRCNLETFFDGILIDTSRIRI